MATETRRIILVNEFISKGFKQHTDKVGETEKSHNKLNKAMGKTSKRHADLLTRFTKVRWAIVNVALITAIVAALTKLSLASLQTRFEMVRLANVSSSSFERVRDVIIDLQKRTNASTEELIDSLQEMTKSGFDFEESQQIVAASIGASLVGFASLKDTTLATAQVLKQFNLEAGRAEEISFKLAAAANIGRADIENLGTALKFVGAIADQSGTSFEELIVTIAELSNQGLELSQIGRGLRQVFISLLSPSEQTKRVMKAFNIEIENTDGSLKSLLGIVDSFNVALEGLSDPQRKNIIGKIFPANAITTFITLMGGVGESSRKALEPFEREAVKGKLDSIILLGEGVIKTESAFKSMGLAISTFTSNILESFSRQVGKSVTEVDLLIKETLELGEEFGVLSENTKEFLKNITSRPLAPAGILPQLGLGEGEELRLFKVRDIERIITANIEIKELTKNLTKLKDVTEENVDSTDNQSSKIELLSDEYDAAILEVISFNKEQKEILKVYGDTEKAQSLINLRLNELVNELTEVEEKNVATIFREMASAQEEAIDTTQILKDELGELTDELSDVQEEMSQVEKTINKIQSRRFDIRGISETRIENLVARQELEIQKAQFATLGLGTAEEFLRKATILTSDSIKDQTSAIMSLTDAATQGQDRFEAWKTTLNETIKDLIINSEDLDKDVTGVVLRAQTELLSINRFDRERASQFSELENNLSTLRQAQGILFGEERQQLEFSEKLREDKIDGVNLSAKTAINALEDEREELDRLIERQLFSIELQKVKRDEIEETRISVLIATEQEKRDRISMFEAIEEKERIRIEEEKRSNREATSNVISNIDESLIGGSSKVEGVPISKLDPRDFISLLTGLGSTKTTNIETVNIEIDGSKNARETALEVKRQLASLG